MSVSSSEQLIAAVRETVSVLEQASLLRTKYVLQNYSRYRANSNKALDRRISESVLDILSSHFADRTPYSPGDEALMDRCGYLLVPAIEAALDSIKSMPVVITSIVYPVLYHRYFHADGPAIDMEQLLKRLAGEGFKCEVDDVLTILTIGERIMSSLLFGNHILYALKACS